MLDPLSLHLLEGQTMRHVRFKFTIDCEIAEVDLYQLDPDELYELPGVRTEYSTGKVDDQIWACKLTGVVELLEANPLRFISGEPN
jgi:hypothetical protein